MESYYVYLLKASVSLAVMYGFYRLFLQGETFHRVNRMIIIGVTVACWLIPYIELPTGEVVMSQQIWRGVESVMVEMKEVVIYGSKEAAPGVSMSIVFGMIYLLGVCWRCLLVGRSMIKIDRIFKQGFAIEWKGKRVVIGSQAVNSFSFGRKIYIQSEDYADNFEIVFAHESAHLHHRHTVDLIWIEIVIALQWFNPVIYFLKKRLMELHEYEADQSVVRQGIDAKIYQRLLIQKSMNLSNMPLFSRLNQSSIKKRITMMLKKKSSGWASLKLVGIIPAACVCVSLCANSLAESTSKVMNLTSTSDVVVQSQRGDLKVTHKGAEREDLRVTHKGAVNEDEVMEIPEKNPSFPGGPVELRKFLTTNIKYPAEALSAGKQGTVICSFIVEKDGSITNIKFLRKIDPQLDAEALRVIKAMPKWIPGENKGEKVRVAYTVPISFKCQ